MHKNDVPELLHCDIPVEGPYAHLVEGVFVNSKTHCPVVKLKDVVDGKTIRPGDFFTSKGANGAIRLNRISDEPWPAPRYMANPPMPSAA